MRFPSARYRAAGSCTSQRQHRSARRRSPHRSARRQPLANHRLVGQRFSVHAVTAHNLRAPCLDIATVGPTTVSVETPPNAPTRPHQPERSASMSDSNARMHRAPGLGRLVPVVRSLLQPAACGSRPTVVAITWYLIRVDMSVIHPPVRAVGDDGAAGVIGGSHEAHHVPEADAS